LLDRDHLRRAAEKCPQCEKAFCSICINEHLKVHRPTPVEPKKIG
jgi:hypothetical protein